ncbi:MAG TPA: IS110 family transposase [Polyangia bacterium]
MGLDVHKDTIVIAVADQGREGEVRVYGTISSDLHAVERAIAKLRADGAELRVAYEAGPTGFGLYRHLRKMHIECLVVAPSKMPVPGGRRQKNDRRDAELLARLLRAGELTAIHVPEPVDESIRDLTRARADAVDDLRRAKQRLKSFLLRAGYHYTGKADWSEKHQRYLRELRFPLVAHKAVLEEYLLALDQGCERVSRFDDLLAAQVPQWCHYPAVQTLMAMRGFQLVAATVLVAEIDDIRRFAHPRHLMAFLGLVPHEHTTGSTRRIGAITKAGNGHARWMLIETVQSALFPPKVTAALTLRQEGQSAAVKELAWKAQTRLHKRGWHLMARGVMKPKVIVALAREMAGFVWAMLHLVPVPGAPPPAGPLLRRA